MGQASPENCKEPGETIREVRNEKYKHIEAIETLKAACSKPL
jgi:hypothetical protein